MNDPGRLSRALLRTSTPVTGRCGKTGLWLQQWEQRLGGREARGDGLTVFEAFEGSGQLKVKFKIHGLDDWEKVTP